LSLARQHGQGRLALAAIGGGGDQLLLQRARQILQQQKQVDRPGFRVLFSLFLLLLLGTFSLALSISGSVDPAGNTAANSAVRVLNSSQTQEPGLFIPAPSHTPVSSFTPVSMENIQVIKTPLVAIAAREGRPHLVARIRRRHTIEHHIVRNLPMPMDDYSALVLHTAGPDVQVSPTYIPNAGLRVKYGDTLVPTAKLAWMELMAEKAFCLQVLQLQAGLRTELAYLHEQQANAQKAIMVQMHQEATMEQLLKDFLLRQLQIEQQYQDRMDDLERQWLKTGRRLTIVYI
jgi:hypothetical protein